MDFQITREISVDAAHRVTYHESKCKNIHGHRYKIHATCVGQLFEEGAQEGMVMDFAFLKSVMMDEIDEPCDHGLILWDKDEMVDLLVPALRREEPFHVPEICLDPVPGRKILDMIIQEYGYAELPSSVLWPSCGKMYIVPFVPTAENLAKHWFERLAPKVSASTDGRGHLQSVKVWETPNCSAQFPPLTVS